jgi:D-psicose/D-tagatose/L-ribulose 3-epimerase
MRLAISNIAWDVEEDAAVADLLGQHQIDAIDIAPGKYFPKPSEATPAEMERVRTWWAERGIEITGMQALLFGTTGLNVFGDETSRRTLLDHLAGVARIGSGLGATRIVFGSPKNRDRTGLDDQRTRTMAKEFFGQLGDIAAREGVLFCLEPNPECYGANFMVDSDETAEIVRFIDHPAIRMQLDTGALTLNGEHADTVLARHASLIGHVHASEPQLVPLGDGDTDHRAASSALRQYLPEHLITIEMVATRDEPHLQSIERALDAASRAYRDGAAHQ